MSAVNNPKLLGRHLLTIRGTLHRGVCTIVPPRLKLRPRQRALEADEISVNPATCTSSWQIGTPVKIVRPAGRAHVRAKVSTKGRSSTGHWSAGHGGITPAGQSSSSGYEYAWTTDIVNITLTSDRTNISWSWEPGYCLFSSSGSAWWSWESATGWSSPYNNGSWIYRGCGYTDVWSQATFSNGAFCWPSTVYSSYSGVYAEGWNDGSLYGWVNKMSYSGSCLPLYLHSEIIRVT